MRLKSNDQLLHFRTLTSYYKLESGLSRVVQVPLDSPYVLSQRHCDQTKSLSQTNQCDQAWKKETYPVPNRLLKVFGSILFAVWGFWWKNTAWYILNNQNQIVSDRIGPNSYLDTTSRGFLMMIHFVFELFTRETVQWIILDHKRKSSSLSTWLKDEIMLWR